ncbi:hypothetical protein EHS25_008207 [Saitozyma podzolica]|uniref:Nucleic acid-binding protein n=1 Tax=Saitozyma podzolica TaxID=1890683 RepID=A0A427YNX2_9TREE|nr:hypothetical protein EHS25_008207 [Saitozyma podzolica]
MLSSARAIASASVKPFARSFSTSRVAPDLAKVLLIGRLGADPILRHTASNKPYYTLVMHIIDPSAVHVGYDIYNVATSGPSTRDESGTIHPGPTSWHTVFAFNENAHPSLTRVGKGSTVYVEADLEMRPVPSNADGSAAPDRAFLRHLSLRVINRVRPEGEETPEGEE